MFAVLRGPLCWGAPYYFCSIFCSIFTPQVAQNLFSGKISPPHFAHLSRFSISLVPHSVQYDPTSTSCPLGQRMFRSLLLRSNSIPSCGRLRACSQCGTLKNAQTRIRHHFPVQWLYMRMGSFANYANPAHCRFCKLFTSLATGSLHLNWLPYS